MDDLIKKLENKIKPLIGILNQEFSGLRTNRPTPALIENIDVDYAGEKLKLKQVGSINVVLPRELQVNVWDKGIVASVAKAIENSSRGLTSTIEGNVIRLRLPALTQERREEMARLVKIAAEKTRIKLRNLRDETNKEIMRAADLKTINEDKKFKFKDEVQEVIDKSNQEIETLVNNKIKEINE